MDRQPDLDLAAVDLYDPAAIAALALPEGGAEALLDRLRERQRVARVAPDGAVAARLLEAGLDSAHRIAAMPERRFVREHADLFAGDERAAGETHRRAVAVKSLVKHVHANLRDVISPHLGAMPSDPVDRALRDYVARIPDYEELFGPLAHLSCSHCASIFGPAAYFLDLMRVTDDYITDANTPPRGRSLRDRRPDLFELDLTCENTDRPVPTLQIVGSVLARRIAAEQPVNAGTVVGATRTSVELALSASDHDDAYTGMLVTITAGAGRGETRSISAYTGATRTAAVDSAWTVVPDATSSYRIARDPYMSLACAPYPFSLPWNLPLEHTRHCLGGLGTALADVYGAFTGPTATGTAQAGSADTITLAPSASSHDGEYVAMLITLVGGTGAGQTRPVASYSGAAKVATVSPPWPAAPEAGTRYEILDVSPIAREELGLSIEEQQIVTTPRTTAAELALMYGVKAIDLNDLARVDTFLARSGLARPQLADLLTQRLSAAELAGGLAGAFFINATGDPIPAMRIVTDASDPNHPFARIDGLTLRRLDRLNRFIRLAAALAWSFEELDWALRSVGASEISVPVLVSLGAILRVTVLTELGVLEICAFWSEMKTTGRGDGPHPADLFDRTFNAAPQLGDRDPYTSATPIPFDPARPLAWRPGAATGLDAVIRSRLRGALGVSDDDLTRIATFAAGELGVVPPLRLDLTMLTWLFRLAAGARLMGLTVTESLTLLRVTYFPDAVTPPPGTLQPTVEGVLNQAEQATWLRGSPFTVASLAYVVADLRTPEFAAPYEPDDLGPFLENLAAVAASARLTPSSFANENVSDARAAESFDRLVAAGFITADGIILDTASRFAAAAAQFPLTPPSLAAAPITPGEAASAFVALEGAEPPLLLAQEPPTPPTARLSPWYTDVSDLGFLFAGDADAPNKRRRVADVLSATRGRIAVSELAGLFELTARHLISANIDAAGAARALDALLHHSPPILDPDPASNETRAVLAYDGPSRTITVDAVWSAIPSTGSPYEILDVVARGTARAGALLEISLNGDASTVDGAYVGMTIGLTGGAGDGEENVIAGYDGASRVARCAAPWATIPGATTTYTVTAVVTEGAVRAADATHVTLAGGAALTNDAYAAMTVRIIAAGSLSPEFDASTDLGFLFASAGLGERRTVTAYAGATRTATVESAWSPVPDATSAYRVTRVADRGTAQGATATTIVLAVGAAPDDRAYNGMTLTITAGAGAGQTATIAAYAGATRTAMLTSAWTTIPDTTSGYSVIAIVATGMARGGSAEQILLAPGAAADDGAYDGMTVEIVPEPGADLMRGQVRQVLLADKEEMAHAAGVIAAAVVQQHRIALQGLADFLGTSAERLGAEIPVATLAADLSSYLADLLTEPPGGQVPARLRALIAILARAHVTFALLGTSVAQMRGVAALPHAFNIAPGPGLSLSDVQALSTLASLARAFSDDGAALVDYLRRPPDPTPPGPKMRALSALTGWPADQIAALSALLWPNGPGFSHADDATVAGIARLRRCFQLVSRTGLDVASMLQLHTLATVGVLGPDGQINAASWLAYEQASALAVGALAARFSAGDAAGAIQTLHGTLDEGRRDALVSYAIWLLHAREKTIDSPNALYEYLLIDVEMASCSVTSYIAQGIASMQLYMQRCHMMLEPGIVDLSGIPQTWWEWLSTYRVWEANRKVFLYPENYLRPGARRGSTPAFERLDQSLMESNVSEATVSGGMRQYLDDLATISKLVLCGAYEAREPKPGTSVVQATGTAVSGGPSSITLATTASALYNHYVGMLVTISSGPGHGGTGRITAYDGSQRQATVGQPWTTQPDATSTYVITGPRQLDRLVLVGHTPTDPGIYFHRGFDPSRGWTPWKEIKLAIPTPLVSPVIAFGRLLLFWSEVKTVDGSSISSSTQESPRSVTVSSTTCTVKFSYLAPNGTWTAPQSTGPELVLDYERDYRLVDYVSASMPDWTSYFDGRLVIWQKVYPLHIPAEKVVPETPYPSGEQVLLNRGFAWPWVPLGRVPVPDAPSESQPADLVALETDVRDLCLRTNAIARAPLGPNQGHLPLSPSLLLDAALGRTAMPAAIFDYRLDAPAMPYGPVLQRSAGTLGIAMSATNNVILDDFYGDDYPGASLPTRPAATVGLLGKAAGAVGSVTTVTNRPGSFVFDNGDEAFLVRSSDAHLLPISEALLAYGGTPPLPAGPLYLSSEELTTADPPPAPTDLRFSFERITTDVARRLVVRLASGGLDALLSVDSQRTPELPFSRLDPSGAVRPPATDRLDFAGAYGLYFHELFFHAPFLIADTLGGAQRFAEAKTWLEKIFNPTQPPDPGEPAGTARFWRFLPFRDMTLESLTRTLTDPTAIEAYNDDPLDPDAIARLRISAYAKAAVIRYVDNLIEWGDYLFAHDTREAIDQATNLYVMAGDLLGRRPEPLGTAAPPAPASFDDIKQSFTDRTITTGKVTAATAATVTLDPSASTLDDAYTGMYLAITAGPASGTQSFVLAYDGVARKATLETPWTTPPTPVSTYRVFVQGIPQFLIRLENSAFVVSASTEERLDDAPFNDVHAYFCVPENDRLTGCWDRVEDRLYKIRHCMNIAGQVRDLPLFAPPIDPLDLIDGRRAGGSAMSVAAHVQMPIPKYRFAASIERARALSAAVSQLGSTLLSALERRDGEAIALLQTSQQRRLLELATVIKRQQIEDATLTGTALAASLEAAQGRKAYYEAQVSGGLSPAEVANIATMTLATVFNVLATATRTAAAIGYALPQAGSPFAMTYGGQQIGAALSAGSGVFEGLAQLSSFGAQLSITLAQYQRREEEWAMQAELAGHDVDQISAQRAANDARLKIAQRDLLAHETAIAQNDAIDGFLKSKFTSQELYQWMATRLSTLHFQTYSIALDLVRSAQRAYQYELGTDETFVNFGYWDDGRRGLLAGEGLALACNQMERSYVERNARSLEIEKTISLLQINPRAVLDLISTGGCVFELPEKLFDDDFPGHYARRIKTLSISIPAITGPYQNISATLTQLTNQLVIAPDARTVSFLLGTPDAPMPGAEALRANWWANQQIALSTGVSDDGLFEPALSDERYLPFEGTGVVSTWRLSMPKQTNRIDFGTISDVVLQLRYTALDGGAPFRDQVMRLPPMRATAGSVFLPFAQRFSTDWYAFLHEPTDGVRQVMRFELADLVPPHVGAPQVTGMFFHLGTPAGTSCTGAKSYLQLRLGSSVDVAFNLDAAANHTLTFPIPPSAKSLDGPASLTFVLADTPPDLKSKATIPALDPAIVENAVLVLFYQGRVAW